MTSKASVMCCRVPQEWREIRSANDGCMQLIDGRPIYSISDLMNDVACEHLSELERLVALARIAPPAADAGKKLIARKADEHERRYLAELIKRHGADAVVECRAHLSSERSELALRSADAETLAAMSSGAAAIYQPTFFDGAFVGRADFLRRIEVPCPKWPWSYELVDTKLALSVKAQFPIQLSHYNEQLRRLQGRAAEFGYIALGDGSEQSFRMRDFAAYYRRRRFTFTARMNAPKETYPAECSHCAICRWSKQCDSRRDFDDHLSIVANIRNDQIGKLQNAGITTLAALAQADDAMCPPRLGAETFAKLRAQARLQYRQRNSVDGESPYYYELLEANENEGFAQLPQPDTGDVFFDIEGDPMDQAERGLEYLWGFMQPLENDYRAFWARDDTEERNTFEAVIDYLLERRTQYPNMHVYHYAPYEITALNRLAGMYATREDELDQLLRANFFVDLYAVVRQTVRISQPSYSIKKLEPFYGMVRNTDVRRGDDSIVQFEEWLTSGDESILRDIEQYNDDDCRSTYLLRQWLLERKAELEAKSGKTIAWRGAPQEKTADTDSVRAEIAALRTELLAGLSEPKTLAEFMAWPEDLRARRMLAHLLEYHRRDQRPAYFKYFQRIKNTDDLVDGDHEAIGGLRYRADIEPHKEKPKDRNYVYTFSFPEQQHNLSPGSACSPEWGEKSVEITFVDNQTNTIKLKLGDEAPLMQMRSLIPSGPVRVGAQKQAVEAIAREIRADGIATPSAVLDLVLARRPRLLEHAPEKLIQPESVEWQTIARIIKALDRSCLVIQGPPGTGKSTKAASIILDLLAQGKTVGILSGKHKAVHNLLHKIEEVAFTKNQRFQGFQKFSKGNVGSKFESALDDPMIVAVDSNAHVNTPHDLIGGTQWLFASQDLVGKYDYLFIDEAGQLSLADALACAPSAKNLVLLGDPLQLAHVSQGTHPLGTGHSVLTHLLGADPTVPPDRGIFLDVSYRMPPSICTFISETVYESRLSSGGTSLHNRIAVEGFPTHGLRYMPVEHTNNVRESIEEAEIIAREITVLLQGEVILGNHPARKIRERDILVVTPYNAQRKLVLQALAERRIENVAIGTVDKFQGLEAPIVFYSMATSSGADIPRNIEFLFELNRLNVAISRAQCLAVLVCSPQLLQTKCSQAEQITLVNVLCQFVEYCEGGLDERTYA
jgi:predicted RecB family nuclease